MCAAAKLGKNPKRLLAAQRKLILRWAPDHGSTTLTAKWPPSACVCMSTQQIQAIAAYAQAVPSAAAAALCLLEIRGSQQLDLEFQADHVPSGHSFRSRHSGPGLEPLAADVVSLLAARRESIVTDRQDSTSHSSASHMQVATPSLVQAAAGCYASQGQTCCDGRCTKAASVLLAVCHRYVTHS